MTPERIRALETNDDLPLTPEETAEGWHFCWDWDGMLVGPGTPEWECCACGARASPTGAPYLVRDPDA